MDTNEILAYNVFEKLIKASKPFSIASLSKINTSTKLYIMKQSMYRDIFVPFDENRYDCTATRLISIQYCESFRGLPEKKNGWAF